MTHTTDTLSEPIAQSTLHWYRVPLIVPSWQSSTSAVMRGGLHKHSGIWALSPLLAHCRGMRRSTGAGWH